jgi:hypothetical protein
MIFLSGVRLRIAAAAALLAMAGVSSAAERPGRGDQSPIPGEFPEDVDVPELNVEPPPYPRKSDLAEFTLRNPTPNHFFIDTTSLSVGKDRIIRFVMVIRTAAEETNVRFSGLRCSDRNWKDYAFANEDKVWKAIPDAQWKRITEIRYNNYQDTLFKDFFCLTGVLNSKPLGDAKKLAKLLRNPPKPDNRIPFRND